MRISVLMSLFEKERPDYFDLSMKSIWDDQTRKPDEIVLVEDGPITDALDAIVNKWQKKIPVMKVVKLAKNQGLPIALNEGIKHCDCDYIARMDTDDIALPGRFKIQDEYLQAHPDLAVLGGGVIEFSDEEGDMEPRIMPSTLREIKAAIPKSCPFIHPAVFIKKSVFDNGIEYNPKSRKYQDLELWFNILAAGYNVANIDDLLIKFRKDILQSLNEEVGFIPSVSYGSNSSGIKGILYSYISYPICLYIFNYIHYYNDIYIPIF